MKQLSTRTLAIISLIAIAILALGVFVIQRVYNTPLSIVENEVEQKEDEIKEKENSDFVQKEEYDFSKDLDVSTWKTYESKKVGIRIKYPENWEIIVLEDANSDIGIRSPIHFNNYVDSLYFGLIQNTKNLSIEDLFTTFDDTSRLIFSRNSHENVIVSGRSGVHFSEINDYGYYSEEYFMIGKNLIYSFQYDYKEGQKDPIISQILKKIVENFEPLE